MRRTEVTKKLFLLYHILPLFGRGKQFPFFSYLYVPNLLCLRIWEATACAKSDSISTGQRPHQAAPPHRPREPAQAARGDHRNRVAMNRANLLLPFRRDGKSDLAHGSGTVLLASKIRQVLATEGATPYSSGELLWRTDFGAAIDRLRHQNNNAVLAELAKVYVRDALERWVPEVELTSVDTVSEGATLYLRVRYKTKTQESGEVTLPIQE